MIDQKLSLAANNCRDDNTVKNLSPKVPLDFNIDEKNTNVEFNAQQVSHISFMFRSAKSSENSGFNVHFSSGTPQHLSAV